MFGLIGNRKRCLRLFLALGIFLLALVSAEAIEPIQPLAKPGAGRSIRIMPNGCNDLFYVNKAKSQSQSGNMAPPEIQTSRPQLTRDELIRALIECTWRDRMPPLERRFDDFNLFRFDPDGKYCWNFRSDYVPTPHGNGKWDIAEESSGQFILKYDDGSKRPLRLGSDGKLIVSGLWACGKNPLQGRTIDIPALELKPEVAEAIKELTSHKWKLANDANGNYQPEELEFRPEGKALLSYENGKCQNKGHWGISGKNVTVALDESESKCDCRGEQGKANPYGFGFDLDGRELFLTQYCHAGGVKIPYVSESLHLKKGVVYDNAMCSEVLVKIEYDMPIKAGVVNQFEVEIIAPIKPDFHSRGPYSLEKIDIIEGRSEEKLASMYTAIRSPDRSIYTEMMKGSIDFVLATIDLRNTQMKEGERLKFTIPVLFKKRGDTTFSVNAIVLSKESSKDFAHYPQLAKFSVPVK